MELQVVVSILLERRILLESLLEVRRSSKLVTATSSYDSVQVVGDGVSVLHLVKSGSGSGIILCQDLSQSSAVGLVFAEEL